VLPGCYGRHRPKPGPGYEPDFLYSWSIYWYWLSLFYFSTTGRKPGRHPTGLVENASASREKIRLP
jgi:hypothetical protein